MVALLARIAVVVAVLATVSAARAAGSTSSLSWVELAGAEGCGGAPAVAQEVERRLGRHALVSPAQADLSVEGYAERRGNPPRFHAVIVVPCGRRRDARDARAR